MDYASVSESCMLGDLCFFVDDGYFAFVYLGDPESGYYSENACPNYDYIKFWGVVCQECKLITFYLGGIFKIDFFWFSSETEETGKAGSI